MRIGIIGLGKMGGRIAEKLVLAGHTVVVWNRTQEVADQFQQANKSSIAAKSIEELVQKLEGTRIIWMMLPAGEATDTALTQIATMLSAGDIVVDGGNAFYKDTQRRYEALDAQHIRFLGIGVSGGILAGENGYPLMAGGHKSAYDEIVPLLDSLAKPHGTHTYFGTGGAGHFVKMVHNGIEYGMMQAIAEGFGVLEKSSYSLNLLEVAMNWQNGTIIDSFLIDRAKDALEKNASLSDITGKIDATGEAAWTIAAAKESNVPVPVIEKSLDFRIQSQTDQLIQDSFAAKMVAALRREFGGHKVEKK